MDIKELITAKTELEQKISNMVCNAVDEFEMNTQLTPSSITIDLVDVSTVDRSRKRYKITGVNIDIGM